MLLEIKKLSLEQTISTKPQTSSGFHRFFLTSFFFPDPENQDPASHFTIVSL